MTANILEILRYAPDSIDLATLRLTTAYNSYEQMPLSPEKIDALKRSDRIQVYIFGGIV